MYSSRKSPFDCYDDLTVDLLELVYRSGGGSKRRRRHDESDVFPDCGGYGDHLYSFVRFHAAQLNYLARLGIAHAEYARRAMEAFYCGGAQGFGRPGREPDLLFVGAPAAKLSRSFFVDNRDGPEDAKLDLRCSRFRKDSDDKGFLIEQPLFNPNKTKLKKNEQATVEVNIELDKKFDAGSKYYAVVDVDLDGEAVDKLLVCVDVRKP